VNAESAPKGGAPEAATTKQQTRGDDNPDDGQVELGFWHKAASGKVRPAPREPAVTHYGCSCCRWSA